MFLSGDIISLRALEPSDAKLLYKWENDPALWSTSFTLIPFSEFILTEFVTAAHQDIFTNKQLRLMINLNSTGETIGTVDLFEFDPQHLRCGMGIYIHPNFQKKGAAKESLSLIKRYCFFTLHLKQIFVHVNASNAASINLFENAGFEKTGLKKCWIKTGLNTFEDVWFMQLIQAGD
jgi:diamine N-acetyltransferase